MSQKRNWSLAVAAACTQYKSYDDDDEDNDGDDGNDEETGGSVCLLTRAMTLPSVSPLVSHPS